MIIIPIMLGVIPTFAISGILFFPVAKTMAFGGVEIGNIKASDGEIVAGIINLCCGLATT
jgi:predicted methyltransferase